MLLPQIEQSLEADEQYELQVQVPLYVSQEALTGELQLPLGMYIPCSLQPAVQVNVVPRIKMSSPCKRHEEVSMRH